jgi:hypothetical protein
MGPTMVRVLCPLAIGVKVAPSLRPGESWANLAQKAGEYRCCNCGGNHRLVGSAAAPEAQVSKKRKKDLKQEQQKKGKR